MIFNAKKVFKKYSINFKTLEVKMFLCFVMNDLWIWRQMELQKKLEVGKEEVGDKSIYKGVGGVNGYVPNSSEVFDMLYQIQCCSRACNYMSLSLVKIFNDSLIMQV